MSWSASGGGSRNWLPNSVAAEIEGSLHVAEGLIASHAVGVIEDAWAIEVSRAVESGQADPAETAAPGADPLEAAHPDPVAAFVKEARDAFSDVSTRTCSSSRSAMSAPHTRRCSRGSVRSVSPTRSSR